MHKSITFFTVLLILTSITVTDLCALPAFPGAQGFGANATGGRGGNVIHVTNLNPIGPGSFSAAIAIPGPRIIVFDVGGVLEMPLAIDIKPGNGDLTIAGQTAPGGITISGAPFGTQYTSFPVMTDNMIWRHIRARGVHNTAQGETKDVDCISVYKAQNTILDHVSVSWGCDETIDAIQSRNLSFQNMIIGESANGAGSWCGGHPEGAHNFGAIIGYSARFASFSHILWAHHANRTPMISSSDSTMLGQLANMVIYNCELGIRPAGNSQINIQGTYYKPGPNCTGKALMVYGSGDGSNQLYMDDNIYIGREDSDPWTATQESERWIYGNRSKLNSPASIPPEYKVTVKPLMQGYDDVLATAGAFPRDSADRRFVEETKNGTGGWFKDAVHSPLETELMGTPSPTDTDRDGMPDIWEEANGLDPASADDKGDHDKDGYTNIEEYINDLAEILIDKPTANPTGGVESVYNPDYSYSQSALREPSAFAAYTHLSVYPNPCRSRIHVSFEMPVKSKVCLRLYNTIGQQVSALFNNREIQGKLTVNLDAGSLTPGIYYLKLATDRDQSAIKKVMILK
jgi:hypothetical protein